MADIRNNQSRDRERLRTAEPIENEGAPAVLRGPADKVGSRGIRFRAVRLAHLGPDVRDALDSGGLESDTGSNGRWFEVGSLLVCIHQLTADSSANAEWTYPKEFGSTPRIVATPQHISDPRFVVLRTVSTSSCEFVAYDEAGNQEDPLVDLVAVGLSAT